MYNSVQHVKKEKQAVYDFIERLVWGKQSKSRKLVIGAHEWHHLKDDINVILPPKQAATALKIIHNYEKRYMKVTTSKEDDNMHGCWMCEGIFGTKRGETGPGVLQTFKGYTVDFRLQQFRKVPLDALPDFIEFDSPEGEKLCYEMHEEAVKQLNKRFGEEVFITI